MLPNRAMDLISSWQLSLNSSPHFYCLIFSGDEDVINWAYHSNDMKSFSGEKYINDSLRQGSLNYSESVTLTESKT